MSKKSGFDYVPPPIEEPVLIKDDPVHGKAWSHPRYGKIDLSFVRGSTTLVDCDFHPNSFVTITIKEANLHRAVSHDHYHERGQIVEVHMSHAQFVAFVTSANQNGVPCTLDWVKDKGQLPRLPPRAESNETKTDMRETVEDALNRMFDLREKMVDKKVSMALINELDLAIQELQANMPFVQRSYEKHVEEVKEKAKAEIHSYLNMTLTAKGLEVLQSQTPQKEITQGEDDDSQPS
jgi:hypothetical protein